MLRLNVPYIEKEEAKALGARWNYIEKYWYCEDDSADRFARWLDPKYVKERASGSSEKKTPADEYETVSAVNELIATYFDNNSLFQFVRVRGEISNHSLWNGHHFFTIKDSASSLKCILWKNTADMVLSFEPEDGQEVGILGTLKFNVKKGEGELVVARITELGEGGENTELRLLRERLAAEGIFDPEHKKEIPKYPKRIGIVSSKEGDAIRDIVRVSHDRNPYVALFLYHVTVQGQSAPASIIRGIKEMDKRGYDLIIVSRGGGSAEDLAPVDDEGVVRAVYMAQTPIVTGVGHERDYTLIDLAADVRFSTPTYAAQGVVPDVMSDIRKLDNYRLAIKNSMKNVLEKRKQGLATRRERLKRYDPVTVLTGNKERLEALRNRLDDGIMAVLEKKKNRYTVLVTRLHGLSPTAKLVQGFGYITRDERPVTTVADIKQGDDLTVRIHDGTIHTKVTDMEKELLFTADRYAHRC
ncbi:MAG: exodeoxyribonuclease VII large subunit [Eubacterium sp.]|nr:exodeoxyribonuclease VII large subunit [Eubacterium sp.]